MRNNQVFLDRINGWQRCQPFFFIGRSEDLADGSPICGKTSAAEPDIPFSVEKIATFAPAKKLNLWYSI
jgi:hypothetical protein